MNYRHAFHAGNFADVVKHLVLTRILLYLHDKPAAFRVIDTHAGAGLYDLGGEEARRGGEWQAGIGRLFDAPPGGEAGALIRPYLDIVRAFNADGALRLYPGSPLIARALLRPQDHLIACEVQSEARSALIDNLRRDEQGRVVDLDGWLALNAFIPPKERRGLVIIDPPFERADEFARFGQALGAALRKWPSGIYLAWYPVKERARVEKFVETIARAAPAPDKVLRVEIEVSAPARPAEGAQAIRAQGPGLRRAGLLIVNPPWTLHGELARVLPALDARLSPDGAGCSMIEMAHIR